MPSVNERRVISWFTQAYNTCNYPRITSLKADATQEAPDAIIVFENRTRAALELTSVGAPKGTSARHAPHRNPDLLPLQRVMERKFRCDYREADTDQVWLLIYLRLTLPRELVETAIEGINIPSRFDRVYLQWPLPEKSERTSVNILELPQHRFWIPNLPRPNHHKQPVTP